MSVPIFKRNVLQQYRLPEEVKFCKKCTVSNQRPRISFDEHGVCNACNFAEQKKNIDWKVREAELHDLCNRHRKTNGSYDVIVPCSGGKDGSFVAHQLKYKYNMTPLTVTWAPNIYTNIGWKNLQSFIASGFDNIIGSVNGIVNRKLVELSFSHLGDPFQAFIYGQTNFPLRMAVQHGVSLIMYGENGEVEYGGDMKNAESPTREITDHDRHYFSGCPPEFWEEYGLTTYDLAPYMPPSIALIQNNKTEIHFMSYYKRWDPQENYYYVCENTGFEANPVRTEGTYSKYASLDDKLDGFHYYLGFIKFGIGRATSDSAHEIRDGKISREEGIALVQKFDGEFPARYYKDFLDYTGITEEHFYAVIDSWRSDHIWKRNAHGEWVLRNAVYTDTQESRVA